MPVGSDFAGFACEFQNLTFCGNQPGNLVGNYWYNWPISQYAARLRLGNLETGYIQAGVYQVNRRDLDDGFNFDPTWATGARAILEGAVFPTFGPFNYRGSYTVGGWYQTAGGPDLYYNTARLPLSLYGGLPLGHQERSGVYGVAVQELYRPNPDEPTRNLSAFLRVTFADPRTSPLDEQETLGLVYKGFWDARPSDWIGVAIGQSHASSAAARGIAAANAFGGTYQPIPGYERVLEVFYSLALDAGRGDPSEHPVREPPRRHQPARGRGRLRREERRHLLKPASPPAGALAPTGGDRNPARCPARGAPGRTVRSGRG